MKVMEVTGSRIQIIISANVIVITAEVSVIVMMMLLEIALERSSRRRQFKLTERRIKVVKKLEISVNKRFQHVVKRADRDSIGLSIQVQIQAQVRFCGRGWNRISFSISISGESSNFG